MTVREGRPADEPALRSLQALLREPSPSLLAHGLRAGGVLVEEAGGEAVGYTLAVAGGAGDGLHVAELVVDPAHRREGRGTRLLSAVVADADGPVTLLVAVDNDAARTLYEDLGFRPRGRRPGFYDDGTDAIVMRRDGGQTASDV